MVFKTVMRYILSRGSPGLGVRGMSTPRLASRKRLLLTSHLQHGPEVTHDPSRLEEWFATWKGPIVSEPGG